MKTQPAKSGTDGANYKHGQADLLVELGRLKTRLGGLEVAHQASPFAKFSDQSIVFDATMKSNYFLSHRNEGRSLSSKF